MSCDVDLEARVPGLGFIALTESGNLRPCTSKDKDISASDNKETEQGEYHSMSMLKLQLLAQSSRCRDERYVSRCRTFLETRARTLTCRSLISTSFDLHCSIESVKVTREVDIIPQRMAAVATVICIR